ncbi:hypothetical protein MJO29_015472 [Puccinia striiformis f. sp. tritici]|nr:hypothetical protein MJO29_015472 [Puccinia striiformis f. sp. tritici]
MGELPTELSLYGRVKTESTYIKSVAPDHLITVGYRGKNGTTTLAVTSRCKIKYQSFVLFLYSLAHRSTHLN